MIIGYKIFFIIILGYNLINGNAISQIADNTIILAEQSQHSIAIVNPETNQVIWQWKAQNSIKNPEHLKWFNSPSDAKPVYGGKYLLITASGGGIALVRISDNKILFYAFAGGNPHSAELLPDGNIVCASSTGNYLTIFRTDTTNYPEAVWKKTVKILFGHNVVWDNNRKVLYSAAMDHLVIFNYNFNCNEPDLIPIDSILIPGSESHDLFPVYNEDALWLTTIDNVFKFNIASGEFIKLDIKEGNNIKSVSSGPGTIPGIIIRPKERWWTDEVLDFGNNSVFKHDGFRIYKARWFINNTFSYGKNESFRSCN